MSPFSGLNSARAAALGLALTMPACSEPAPPPVPALEAPVLPAPVPAALVPAAPPTGSVGTIGMGMGTIGLGTLTTIGHGETLSVIRTGAPELTGEGLSLDVVRRVVRRHINEIRACYEAQLAPAPDLAGRVAVRWVIGEDGSVSGAAIESSTLSSTAPEGAVAALAVGTCVVEAVSGYVYPAPSAGTVTVVYPFVLEPRGAGASDDADDGAPSVEATPGDPAGEGLGLVGTGRGGS